MKISKGILWVTGLILVVYAIGVFVNPAQTIGASGVQLPTPDAVADGRATYGGFVGGVGLFLIFSAINSTRVGAGLWLMVFGLGGFAVGRTLAVLIDSAAATSQTLRLVVFEAVLTALGVIGLWLLPKAQAPTTSNRSAGAI